MSNPFGGGTAKALKTQVITSAIKKVENSSLLKQARSATITSQSVDTTLKYTSDVGDISNADANTLTTKAYVDSRVAPELNGFVKLDPAPATEQTITGGLNLGTDVNAHMFIQPTYPEIFMECFDGTNRGVIDIFNGEVDIQANVSGNGHYITVATDRIDLGNNALNGVVNVLGTINTSTAKSSTSTTGASADTLARKDYVDAETTARTAADTALQTQITTNTNNIATEIMDRKDGDTALQSQITTNATNISTVSSGLSAEITNRTNADTALDGKITSEASTRSAADTALQNNINTVSSNLTTETANRISSDDALNAAINANTANLNTEISNRISGDNTLQSNINTVSSNLSAEITNRTNADTALQTQITTNATAISTETTNRTNADTTLQTNINTVSSNLTTEIANRTSADTNLQTQVTSNAAAISTETTNRTNADTVLDGKIASEASTRAAADSTLQTNIDNCVKLTGSTSQTIGGDVSISGNLTVNGTTTTVNSTITTIDDPLIKFADGNTGNTKAIGFYGAYNNGTDRLCGFSRDPSTNTFEVWTNLPASADPVANNPINVVANGGSYAPIKVDSVTVTTTTPATSSTLTSKTYVDTQVSNEATTRASADTALQTDINNRVKLTGGGDQYIEGNVYITGTDSITGGSLSLSQNSSTLNKSGQIQIIRSHNNGALQNTEKIFSLDSVGSLTSGVALTNIMKTVATQNWTSSTGGLKTVFQTMPTTSTTSRDVLTLNDSGTVQSAYGLISDVAPTTIDMVTRKDYVDTADANLQTQVNNCVKLTGSTSQTINGNVITTGYVQAGTGVKLTSSATTATLTDAGTATRNVSVPAGTVNTNFVITDPTSAQLQTINSSLSIIPGASTTLSTTNTSTDFTTPIFNVTAPTSTIVSTTSNTITTPTFNWQNAATATGRVALSGRTMTMTGTGTTGAYPIIALRRNIGTEAAPSAPVATTTLAAYQIGGYDSATYRVADAFTFSTGALSLGTGNGTAWSSGSTPFDIAFSTCPSGSSTSVARMTISSAGDVEMNNNLTIDGNMSLAGTMNSWYGTTVLNSSSYSLVTPASLNVPTVITASAGFTVPTNSSFTANGNGRLTYTGAITRTFRVSFFGNVYSGFGANSSTQYYVALNGTLVNDSKFISPVGNTPYTVFGEAFVTMSQNQYLEIYYNESGLVSKTYVTGGWRITATRVT